MYAVVMIANNRGAANMVGAYTSKSEPEMLYRLFSPY